MLLSYEKKLLAAFIVASDQQRKEIIRAAILDNTTSGPLINAYRRILALGY